jgi:hypothetical protein
MMANISIKSKELFDACLSTLNTLESIRLREKERQIKHQMLPKWNRWYHATEATARRELGIPEGELKYPWELLNCTVYRLYRFSKCVLANHGKDKEIILDDFEYGEVFGAVR